MRKGLDAFAAGVGNRRGRWAWLAPVALGLLVYVPTGYAKGVFDRLVLLSGIHGTVLTDSVYVLRDDTDGNMGF
ncbi:hypothetical protein [Dyella mobilis]|uniref:Uncharacterized protein n=1 Tax=Dyella mobilis TaxID=1849582 RepID=A0ABS2KA20_9GAMM|nr:hypothetical protein [Dyella mobilis]MBM7127964.1 hypothetical protein [Dyella mobilis]GLQ99214.1 hypothetical protein GCM10007863_36340 [Dyella mobilis]